MDLTNIPLFKAMVGRMGWLGKRQQVLAQNIANADTPGYVPQDLKKQDFGRMVNPGVSSPGLRQTSAGHMDPVTRPSGHGDQKGTKDRKTYETSPTGNAVILEEQLMKVAETQSQYRLATNLYAKHVSMLKQAIGKNNG